MLAIFMVAAEKGFWQTDATTIKRLGGELARLVARNGLPGSGHTAPNHSMWQWLAPQLDAADAQALGVTLAKARGETFAVSQPASPGRATSPTASPQTASENAAPAAPEAGPRYYELTEPEAPTSDPVGRTLNLLGLLAASLALFTLGLWRGRQTP